MTKTTKTVTEPTLLEAALEGLLLQKQRIEEQIRHVRALLGNRRGPGRISALNGVEATPGKRQLSDAARKRIAAAQKKRWAEYRKAAGAAKH